MNSRRTNTAAWIDRQNRWRINVQKDGVRRSFYSSTPGRTGQREANAKADAWLDEGIAGENTRVSQLYAEWIEQLKTEVAFPTWKQYETYGRIRINPAVGHIKISAITEVHLQRILNQMNQAGLSRKYISNTRACINAFLKYCRSRKCTALFPEGLHVPKTAEAGERHILQPDDLRVLFSKSTTATGPHHKETREPLICAYRFEVATGLRPGEVRGLVWSDIADGELTVCRSINQYDSMTPGKNKNARRRFRLTELAEGILREQREYLTQAGIVSEYVFPGEDGDFIHYQAYAGHWRRYVRNEGLTRCHTYELRHTFVSMVKSLPEGYLRALVGHSADMDTYGTYSHEVSGDRQQAAKMVQAVFDRYLK